MKYEVMGYATIKAQVWSLADLRELIAQADRWQLRDDCKIDWDLGCVFIDVADTSRGDVMEPIGCGDHVPTRNADGEFLDPIDFVITAHQCSRNEPEKKPEVKWPSPPGPETWEEAEEERLDREKAAQLTREGQDMEPPTYQARASLTDWLLGNNDDWRSQDYAR